MHPQARRFIEQEKEFHLGDIPTERRHPRTRTLSDTARKNLPAAVRQLLAVDRDIPKMLAKKEITAAADELAGTMEKTIRSGGRIFFTGCGATGRLAILLDAAWRRFWREEPGISAATGKEFCGATVSVMAGGDHALIKSVEGYEDHIPFGERQIKDKDVSARDLVVAVTEGGETSFVIGTARAGIAAGADVWFVWNNPAASIRRYARCREILEEPRIRKVSLSTGPMAIAGSTRMQAVTAELAFLGFCLARCAATLARPGGRREPFPSSWRRWTNDMADIIACLSSSANCAAIARMVRFETAVYRRKGLLTYRADRYALDLLTDTTERSPTFLVPPFIKGDDTVSPPSWAFMVRPEATAEAAWRNLLGRPFNDIRWSKRDIRTMVPDGDRFFHQFPGLDATEILKFNIGSRSLARRLRSEGGAVVAFLAGKEGGDDGDLLRPFARQAGKASDTAVFFLGHRHDAAVLRGLISRDLPGVQFFPAILSPTDMPLDIAGHLAVKLLLNTVSTMTMVMMGRVFGNTMVYVNPSNKKLYDRATRSISQLTGASYQSACDAFFATMDYIHGEHEAGRETTAPVLIAAHALLTGRQPEEAAKILAEHERNNRPLHSFFPVNPSKKTRPR